MKADCARLFCMEIVLGSSNPHKVKEINEIVATYFPLLEERVRVRCQDKTSVTFILPPEGFDPDETGTTFAENSLIKAKAAWELSHTWSLADDSGLCIDALDGKPGIFSARYAETPQKRIGRVLKELDGTENRKAHFTCHMTLIAPDGKVALSCEGRCEGSIVKEQRGSNGFGYDPIFLVDGDTRTMAELSEDEKNQVSHRSKALAQVIEYLKNMPDIVK